MRAVLCMNCGERFEPTQEFDAGVIWRCGNPQCFDQNDRDGDGKPQHAKVYPDQAGAAPAKQASQKLADVIQLVPRAQEAPQKPAVVSQPARQEPRGLQEMIAELRTRLAYVEQQIADRQGFERERDELLAILTRFPEPATAEPVVTPEQAQKLA